MYAAHSRDRVFKEISTTRQLFIDDDVIARVRNVKRTQHTPKKHSSNPLIKKDQLWETTPTSVRAPSTSSGIRRTVCSSAGTRMSRTTLASLEESA